MTPAKVAHSRWKDEAGSNRFEKRERWRDRKKLGGEGGEEEIGAKERERRIIKVMKEKREGGEEGKKRGERKERKEGDEKKAGDDKGNRRK